MGEGRGGGIPKRWWPKGIRRDSGENVERKKRLEGRLRWEKTKKEKEGACIGKQAAGVLPTSDEWGRGRVAAGGDTPNSRVGAHKWLC